MAEQDAQEHAGKSPKPGRPWKPLLALIIIIACLWAYSSFRERDETEPAPEPGAEQSRISAVPPSLGTPAAPKSVPPEALKPGARESTGPEVPPGKNAETPAAAPETAAQDGTGALDLPSESAKTPFQPLPPRKAPERSAVIPPSSARHHRDAASQRRPSDLVSVLETGRTLPPVTKDSMVRPEFVVSLARLLAQSYYPAGTHAAARNQAITTLTLKKLNNLYGHGVVRCLGGPIKEPGARRRALFSYVLHPVMLEGLYKLYAATFLDAFFSEADTMRRLVKSGERPLSTVEKKNMAQFYAARMRAVAAVLRDALEPATISLFQTYTKAEQRMVRVNGRFLEAALAHEEASLDRRDVASLEQAARRKRQLAREYQLSVQEQVKARAALLTWVRRTSQVKPLRNEDILYALAWCQRRTAGDPGAAAALKTMAGILDNLAARLEARAETL